MKPQRIGLCVIGFVILAPIFVFAQADSADQVPPPPTNALPDAQSPQDTQPDTQPGRPGAPITAPPPVFASQDPGTADAAVLDTMYAGPSVSPDAQAGRGPQAGTGKSGTAGTRAGTAGTTRGPVNLHVTLLAISCG